MLEPRIKAVEWKEDTCVLLDQTLIPKEERYMSCTRYPQVVAAIQCLAVRGAPAIGIAGAYAVVLAVQEALTQPEASRPAFLENALSEITHARPTAVNLRWAVEKMKRKLTFPLNAALVSALREEALSIHREDIDANRRMAAFGLELFDRPVGALTYCNTGDLATGGIGTAFGVLRQGYLSGKVTRVFPCETRPVLQGLRLTVYELEKNNIPFTALCDNMAAIAMRDRLVGAVFTGADRVAGNGDSANKVGTYSLAVLARAHGIPFYIVAPTSTFDRSISDGSQIPIEQRSSHEISHILGMGKRPLSAMNPSFDVTPRELITGIICERGVIHHPNAARVSQVLDN